MTRARRQRGFTLTEMMVVVAIIGVLLTLALVYLRPQAKTIDIANRVGDLVQETTRRAVALGPVRPDVVTALLATNTPIVARARTRLTATGLTGAPITFRMERFVEDPLPAATGQWILTSTYTTDPSVAGISFGPGTGSAAALTLNTTWTALQIYCDPDSTCQPFSLFFQNLHDPAGTANYQARLSILPLGGAILTRPDWN